MRLFSRYGAKIGLVTIRNDSVISVSNAFSIVFEFKLLQAMSDVVILNKEGEYRFWIDANGHLRFGVWDGSDYEPSVDCGSVDVNMWYKVIATVNVGTTIVKTVYVDDLANKYIENTQTGSIASTTNDLVIGDGSGDRMVVDMLMFYTKVLDESNCTDILNNDFVYDGLSVFFSFGEGEGTITNDVVRGLSATITGLWTMGRDMENVYNSGGRVVLVRRRGL